MRREPGRALLAPGLNEPLREIARGGDKESSGPAGDVGDLEVEDLR